MTNPDEAKGSRSDPLTKTTNDGKIELTEEELNRVSGGILQDAVAGTFEKKVEIKWTTTTKAK
jgi:bacteriocin-like protein